MATRGAPKGNKNNKKGTDWTKALRQALDEYKDHEVRCGGALLAIAKTVVKQAIAGNKDAYQEIANRLDGKAKEYVEIDATHTYADALTDDELAAIALGRGDEIDAEAGSSKESTELH